MSDLILYDGELVDEATVKDSLTAQIERKREVQTSENRFYQKGYDPFFRSDFVRASKESWGLRI
ncbi:MAG: hypothetical protein WD708_03935 [Kiritimatiellia bacterium]